MNKKSDKIINNDTGKHDRDGDTAKCRDCYIFPEGGQFGCTCKDNGGHDKDSSIDMSEFTVQSSSTAVYI